MKREKAAIGKIVTVARPHGAAGQTGSVKPVFSAYCGAEHVATRGIIEQSYPRFAVLGMLASGKAPQYAERVLYREAFFWEEILS